MCPYKSVFHISYIHGQEKMNISCYYLITSILNQGPSLSPGVIPTAPEQPAEEKSPSQRPDAPPDYNSHFVPGGLNNQKGSFSSSENHNNS